MHVRETPEPHYLASHSTLPRVGGTQTWRRAARPPTPVKSPSLITGAIREGAPHCFLLRTRSASVQANLSQDPPSSASQAVRHVEDLRGRVALEVCGNVMQAGRTPSARAYPPRPTTDSLALPVPSRRLSISHVVSSRRVRCFRALGKPLRSDWREMFPRAGRERDIPWQQPVSPNPRARRRDMVLSGTCNFWFLATPQTVAVADHLRASSGSYNPARLPGLAAASLLLSTCHSPSLRFPPFLVEVFPGCCCCCFLLVFLLLLRLRASSFRRLFAS